MRYGSLCSGIEAATVAWEPLGWTPAFFSEIEPFACAALAHHYPNVPNFGDMTKFQEWPDADIDVLVGGTPCQSFSVAGLRGGMADARGNLALVYLEVARRYRPKWLVWENVPGVLSSSGGRDFGSFLGGLVELGYGFCYRVLDAQYFGLAQRRKRVFVVGYLGDWRRAAAVLLEPESLRGDSPPRREARKDVAPTVAARTRGGGGLGTDFDCDGGLIAGCLNSASGHAVPGNSVQDADQGYLQVYPPIAMCLNAGAMGRIDAESETLIPTGGYFDVAHSLRAEGFDASEDGTGRGIPLVFDETQITSAENRSNPQYGDPSHPLAAGARPPTIAFTCKDSGADAGEIAPTLRAMNEQDGNANAGGQVAVAIGFGHQEDRNFKATEESVSALTKSQGLGLGLGLMVRRLTPTECERLQGFPDSYTKVPYRGKPAADGPRYRALGNSFAVPVVRWIGQQIERANNV